MDPKTLHQNFLKSVSSLNSRFNRVRAGAAVIPLNDLFWSAHEMKAAQGVKEDWGVPTMLWPFYGDWHTLICLNIDNNTIEMLNDARDIVFTWQTIDDFENSLESVPETPKDASGIDEPESWLDF